MKLFVIVICLLSERFLLHSYGNKRESLFAQYITYGRQLLMRIPALTQPWIMLVAILAPVVLVVMILSMLLGHWLFGLVGLVINVVIFYLCLGPNNPFYPMMPVSADDNDVHNQESIKHYFSLVNGQLFAVIFWYILTGPTGLIIYRLITQMQKQEPVQTIAQMLTNFLEWLPARMTVVLYMLVGNFQHTIKRFLSLLLAAPIQNEQLLADCGLLAAQTTDAEQVTIIDAENFVVHATVVLLVIIAFFTLVAWL